MERQNATLKPQWIRIDISCVADFADDLAAEAADVFEVAVETMATGICLYLPEDRFFADGREQLEKMLDDFARTWSLDRPPSYSVSSVADEDWLAEWKRDFKPLRVGKHLIIAPTWEQIDPDPQDRIIRIDPGQAFGTGHHETTRLCLEWLEGRAEAQRLSENPPKSPFRKGGLLTPPFFANEIDGLGTQPKGSMKGGLLTPPFSKGGSGGISKPGAAGKLNFQPRSPHDRRSSSLLDVGTGSGILAIASALLGFDRILAVDNDPEAIAVARTNLVLNGVADAIALQVGTAADIHGRYDVVLANIQALPLIAMAGILVQRLNQTGALVLSGILVEQKGAVQTAFEREGLGLCRTQVAGEWCLLEFESSSEERT